MITVRFTKGMAVKLPFSRYELEFFLEAMLGALGLEEHDLELALVDDTAMAALNRKYLGCHGPTNVLSFPAGEHALGIAGAEAGIPLGQLVLAPETVRREAFLYGQELPSHVLWLLAHGVVHLAGHEHGPVMDALAEEAFLAADALTEEATPWRGIR